MFNGRSIPIIKFNPEKVSVTTITHDFHNRNKKGKLPLPWFDLDTMQKRNISQKNVFTFSDTGAAHNLPIANKESHDTDFETVTDLVSVIEEKTEDIPVAKKRNGTAEIPKKREFHRRKIQYETLKDDIKKEPTIHSIHPKVSKKTIKIPFSLFAIIHNFRYPPIFTEVCNTNVSKVEVQVEQGMGSKSRHNFEMEDTIKLDHRHEPTKHPKASKKTTKIPFSLFEKIHLFRYPPIFTEVSNTNVSKIEVQVEQELVPKSRPNFEMEDTLKLDHKHEPTKHPKASNKTTKIPFYLFEKIHYFRYPPISTETSTKIVHQSETQSEQVTVFKSEPTKHPKASKKTTKIPFSLFEKIHHFRHPPISAVVSTNIVQQIKVQAEQEIVSKSEPNLEMEEKLEFSHQNETDQLKKMSKKTLKIPLSLFTKIHNFRYSMEANSNCDPQIEEQAEQGGMSPSEPNLEMEEKIASDTIVDISNEENNYSYEDDKTNHSNKLSGQTETRLRRLTIPFSTFVEIDNFLHPPLFGSTDQKTFTFIDPSDNNSSQMDTKLVDTVTYIHEQPYCHLFGFKSHELIFSTNNKSVERGSRKEQKEYNRAIAIPVHNSLSMKEGETNNPYPNHKYVYTRVPVIIGDYNVEVCLDEVVLFEEKVDKVKGISKVVELTNFKFVPTKFSPSSTERDRIALKGKLFIEGNIEQSIEYLTAIRVEENTELIEEEQLLHPLQQNIVIELIIQLLQVQTVINQQLT